MEIRHDIGQSRACAAERLHHGFLVPPEPRIYGDRHKPSAGCPECVVGMGVTWGFNQGGITALEKHAGEQLYGVLRAKGNHDVSGSGRKAPCSVAFGNGFAESRESNRVIPRQPKVSWQFSGSQDRHLCEACKLREGPLC